MALSNHSKGLVSPNSADIDSIFVRIVDNKLIAHRNEMMAPDPPGGRLSDYIPFYLGPRPPMLYQIATGFEDIEQFPQEDLIYLIKSFESIQYNNLQYFFTDGHARTFTSHFYTDPQDFNKLDWETVYSSTWNNTETDRSRQQRKQAEFLVKDYVPWKCIELIGVFNVKAEKQVYSVLKKHEVTIQIKVSPKKLYYDHL